MTSLSPSRRLRCGFAAVEPGGLYVPVRIGVAGLLRHVDLVRRYLHSAIFHARACGEVQPLAGAFIFSFAGSGAQGRLRLRAGLLRPILHQHNVAVENGRLHLLRRRCRGCRACCARSGGRNALQSGHRWPSAWRRAGGFSESEACPTPVMASSVESGPNWPLRSSAASREGTGAALPRWLSPVSTTPPVP